MSRANMRFMPCHKLCMLSVFMFTQLLENLCGHRVSVDPCRKKAERAAVLAWSLWWDVVWVPGSTWGWLGLEQTDPLVCKLGSFWLVALGDLIVATPSSLSALNGLSSLNFVEHRCHLAWLTLVQQCSHAARVGARTSGPLGVLYTKEWGP
jgi:hypothetical protein